VALHGVAAVSGIYELSLVDRILDGSATDSEVSSYLQFVDALGLLQVLLTIVSGIAVLAWLSRTVEIVPPLGGGTPRRSPREAIGWWFVPVANLFIPCLIVRDVYVRLETPTRRGGDASVLAWWLLFIVGDLVFRVIGTVARGATTIDAIRSLGMIAIVANVATSLGGLLLIWIIGEIEARAAERAGDGLDT
jgi:TRAP-type C4-dicarboxylate transport system permease large subunit